MKVGDKIRAMMRGDKINITEGRPVLHTALRMPRDSVLEVDGVNIIHDIWDTLDKVKAFSERVRNGVFRG